MEYWMIGSDGRSYGPVDAETMRRWIAESRVVATTQVRCSQDGPWTDATLVPGLASAFGTDPPEDPPVGAAVTGGAGAPPTAPVPVPLPADWPPPAVSVTQLVSGILNLVAAASWLFTCFGIVLTVPLVILGVHELVAFSRARTTEPSRYLESAGRMAIFDLCTLLALNLPSAICGVVILTQIPAARERVRPA